MSAIQGNGQPQRGAADRDGVALEWARRRKETACPELMQPGSRARLVVLALEVGGPLADEAMEQAWRLRWFSILSCATARAFAASLLELRRTWGGRSHAP